MLITLLNSKLLEVSKIYKKKYPKCIKNFTSPVQMHLHRRLCISAIRSLNNCHVYKGYEQGFGQAQGWTRAFDKCVMEKILVTTFDI